MTTTTLTLKWADIDWKNGRFRVHSSKTEHHPGKATRKVPLFPELRVILDEAFEMAADGAVYVVANKCVSLGGKHARRLEELHLADTI